MNSFFKDKTLMITGGTGSFGNTVLKRLLHTDIKEVIIFSRDEKKQEDMRIRFKNSKIKFILGDVRDFSSMYNAMHNVDYVFHAAALKQVPSCEFYPFQAVKTNVIGTENVLNAAIEQKVAKVVLLSTDKAVYPINAMGISKAMAEKILIAKSRGLNHSSIFCATRYGNVIASRGSVIPLFIEKILASKSITITDPMMTRFLMSLKESVDLVLHAFEHGVNGDIFVQKSPACTVGELAVALKKLFKSKVPLDIIGTRHGEKLYETLVSREEMSKAKDMGKYFRIPADNRDLNYELFISQGSVEANTKDDYTSHNTMRLKGDELISALMMVDEVKEYLHTKLGSSSYIFSSESIMDEVS